MRKLDTQYITNTISQPIKGGTLVHLQVAYQEALDALARNIVGVSVDNTKLYVLFGCVNTGTYPAYNISGGAIFYNGEVFLVDAVAFTATGSNVAVASIATTYNVTNADPVTFTDGVAHNVHQIRKIVFAAGASGSGLSDISGLLQTQLALVNDQQGAMPASYTVTFDQDRAVFFSSAPNSATITFDFTAAVPGAVVRLKWTFGAAKTLSVTQPSGSNVLKDSGDLSNVASNTNLFYAIYLGRNTAGNHEVSYTLKQV